MRQPLGPFSAVLADCSADAVDVLMREQSLTLPLAASTDGALPPQPDASASINTRDGVASPPFAIHDGERASPGEPPSGTGSMLIRIFAVPVLGVPPAVLMLATLAALD